MYTYDKDGSQWDKLVSELIDAKTRIVAFRGAGSYNGITPKIADAMMHARAISIVLSAKLRESPCAKVV